MNRHNSTFKVKPKAQSKPRNYAPPRSLDRTKARQVARDEKLKARGQQRPKGLGRGKGLKMRVPSKAKTVAGASEREIRDECDELVRKILKLRDVKCVILECTATEGLQVGHYIKRGVLALRWSLQNCNLQCDCHNETHNTDPKPYRNAMFLRYGIGVTFRIEGIAKENPRLEYLELLAIRDGLRGELAAQKQRRAA